MLKHDGAGVLQSGISARITFFIILCSILLSKSLYYEWLGQTLLLFPFAVWVLYLSLIHNVRITEGSFWLVILYVVLIAFSINVVFSTTLMFFLRTLIAIYVVELVPFEVFSKGFTKIILVIGAFSLLTFPFLMLQIHSPLPSFIASDGRPMANFIVFAVPIKYYINGLLRNSGLWWEPGAFAVFVNLAYIFCILNNENNFKKTMLFFVLICSTVSTTGVFAFVLIFIASIKRIKLHRVNTIVLMFILAVIFALFSVVVLPGVIKKFDPNDSSFVSFLSRINDVELSYELFKSHWLFGYGFGALEAVLFPACPEYLGSFVCTSPAKPTAADGITMFLSQLGVFSIFVIWPVLFPRYLKNFSLYRKILFAIAILMLLNTENFSYQLIFNLLTFYGLKESIALEMVTADEISKLSLSKS